jgi:hypothetical protein
VIGCSLLFFAREVKILGSLDFFLATPAVVFSKFASFPDSCKVYEKFYLGTQFSYSKLMPLIYFPVFDGLAAEAPSGCPHYVLFKRTTYFFAAYPRSIFPLGLLICALGPHGLTAIIWAEREARDS